MKTYIIKKIGKIKKNNIHTRINRRTNPFMIGFGTASEQGEGKTLKKKQGEGNFFFLCASTASVASEQG